MEPTTDSGCAVIDFPRPARRPLRGLSPLGDVVPLDAEYIEFEDALKYHRTVNEGALLARMDERERARAAQFSEFQRNLLASSRAAQSEFDLQGGDAP